MCVYVCVYRGHYATEAHKNELILDPTLEDIVACDLWARKHVEDTVASGSLTELVCA